MVVSANKKVKLYLFMHVHSSSTCVHRGYSYTCAYTYAASENFLFVHLRRNSPKHSCRYSIFPHLRDMSNGRIVTEMLCNLLTVSFLWSLGNQVYHDVEYSGTFFVNTRSDDDIIGIVFGYQSPTKFFIASWKQSKQVYWDSSPFRATAEAAVNIKVTYSFSRLLICAF